MSGTPFLTYEALDEFVGARRDSRKFKWGEIYVVVYSGGGVVSLWVKQDMIATMSKNKVYLRLEFTKDSPSYLKELAQQVLADN